MPGFGTFNPAPEDQGPISCLVSWQEHDGAPNDCPGTMNWIPADDGGPFIPDWPGYWLCDCCGATASPGEHGQPILDE